MTIMNETQIMLIEDNFKQVKFWAELLNNDKLNSESVKLVNKGLQGAIEHYLAPPLVFKPLKDFEKSSLMNSTIGEE